jgi:deoxyribose-phosphate aldolase
MDENRPEAARPIETYESLAGLLEHVMLRPDLSTEELEHGCRTAREYAVRAIVVRPCDVETAVRWMQGSGVAVSSAVGYPYGYSTTGAKLFEGRDLLRLGAAELDFTLNVSKMISRQFQHVETELMQIVKSCHESGAVAKIVYNNRFLADDLKVIATKIVKRVEGDMISLDYREPDVILLRPLLKDVLQLKCAGPVDSLADALAMRAEGFVRLGCTNPAAILDDWKKKLAEEASARAQADSSLSR